MLKDNECWNNWGKDKEEFTYFLMNECFKVFEMIIGLIEHGNSSLEQYDQNKCLNNFASFCNNILMDYVKATKYYKLCIQKNENNVNALIGRGISMIGKGFPNGAKKFFDKAIQIIECKDSKYGKRKEYINGLIRKASILVNKKR